MPRLHPLSLANKRKIREELKNFDTIYYDKFKSPYANRTRKPSVHDLQLDAALAYMNEYPDGLLTEFFEHYINYGYSDMYLDLLIRNFMQDDAGNIVIVDPVVDADIFKAFRS